MAEFSQVIILVTVGTHEDAEVQEALLIIKTQASLVEEVTNLVKTVHSYDVPEVIALPIIGGNPEYLAWINAETEIG